MICNVLKSHGEKFSRFMMCMAEVTEVLGKHADREEGKHRLRILLFLYMVYQNYFVYQSGVGFLQHIRSALWYYGIALTDTFEVPYLHEVAFEKSGITQAEQF